MLASRLCEWYRAARRDLPWRHTRDPYSIWVSEVMLQQTQVKTVLPYYSSWLERFPTAEALAAASEDDVLQAWQGLGYYRRARNLQAGARKVVADGWPVSQAEWRGMPGVGEYTSAAIASIALGERAAVVDGNVERIYARLAGDSSVGLSLTKNAKRWATELMDSDDSNDPSDLNQAMMELGATVCTPRNPDCVNCPVSDQCVAYRVGSVETLPSVEPKREMVRLVRYGLAYCDGGAVALQRIPQGEWWEGMWTLPWMQEPPMDYEYVGKVAHSVTHHRIAFHVLSVRDRPVDTEMFALTELPALPSAQQKSIDLIRKAGLAPMDR